MCFELEDLIIAILSLSLLVAGVEIYCCWLPCVRVVKSSLNYWFFFKNRVNKAQICYWFNQLTAIHKTLMTRLVRVKLTHVPILKSVKNYYWLSQLTAMRYSIKFITKLLIFFKARWIKFSMSLLLQVWRFAFDRIIWLLWFCVAKLSLNNWFISKTEWIKHVPIIASVESFHQLLALRPSSKVIIELLIS